MRSYTPQRTHALQSMRPSNPWRFRSALRMTARAFRPKSCRTRSKNLCACAGKQRPEPMEGEGTGLGLAIAKGIIEAHRGSIAAQSPVADGHGTRVVLTFPREEPAS